MRWRFFSEPLDDLMAAMDAQVIRAKRPIKAMLVALLAGVATWWVYVPVHELLHALGCYMTGGTITELQIGPEYGGALFGRMFPFVTTRGDYAGRLSGFDTHGSDAGYMTTDALPFFLTIALGVPILKAGARGARPALLGPAFVLALAPFYCVTGDYFEMGSVLTTRAATLWRGGESLAFASLRSDDAILLVSRLWTEPAELQLHTPEAEHAAVVIVAVSLLVGALLAFATYAAGAWVARTLVPVKR